MPRISDQKAGQLWKLIRSEQGPDLPLVQVRFDWRENPRNSKCIRALVLESADWVNIVALTSERKLVAVRQFRFGVGRVTTEIPAGIVGVGETPEQAARRELKEETGYTTSDWQYLGWVEPNPAFQNNVCHQWLAQNALKTHIPTPDAGEDISTIELSAAELRSEIRDGKMRNSLALQTLLWVFDLRSGF